MEEGFVDVCLDYLPWGQSIVGHLITSSWVTKWNRTWMHGVGWENTCELRGSRKGCKAWPPEWLTCSIPLMDGEVSWCVGWLVGLGDRTGVETLTDACLFACTGIILWRQGVIKISSHFIAARIPWISNHGLCHQLKPLIWAVSSHDLLNGKRLVRTEWDMRTSVNWEDASWSWGDLEFDSSSVSLIDGEEALWY